VKSLPRGGLTPILQRFKDFKSLRRPLHPRSEEGYRPTAEITPRPMRLPPWRGPWQNA
jgi:hypothetical protein